VGGGESSDGDGGGDASAGGTHVLPVARLSISARPIDYK
jgi:hypothetical protein